MIKLRALLLAAAIGISTAPALADTGNPSRKPPSELTASERDSYREIFSAIRSADWAAAKTKLDMMREGPLQAAAMAELYLAPGSPRVEVDALTTLIASAPELPGAGRLARLAATRGALSLPEIPAEQKLIWQGSQPRRGRAENVRGDAVAAELEALIQPLIVDDRPAEAEAMLLSREIELGSEARTQFQQRIGWSYYLIGDDASARRLSGQAHGGTGEWALHGAWVVGLASWRMRDCVAASDAFTAVASRASDVELAAAGNYWAARADMMCGRPERVQTRLRTAARANETFYGLLAASALGIRAPGLAGLHDYRDAEWRSIARKPNVKAAIALAEIGEEGLAAEYIKHQARIGGASDHGPLLHLACDLNLASTQIWLAHNAPRGAKVNIAARYPRPDWRPARGWRVDNNLVFAHALQESRFQTAAISPAGAQGLMQVRSGTAGDIARSRGEAFDRQQLTDPATNIEYGQSYLEYLRDNGGTGGLLPKVIAAYNAGPAPIAVWNGRQMDRGDPLLYIESIPYWETRGYVPIVLRNYWIYEQGAGKNSTSRDALAQGMWPRFPGLRGATAVRMTSSQTKLASGTE